MGKFDEVIAQAKEAEGLKKVRQAKMGPSMASYIANSGPDTAGLDAEINRIQTQMASSGRAKAVAQFVGGGASNSTASVHAGSTAGLRNEKGALIGLNGTGYDNPNLMPNRPPRAAIAPMAQDAAQLSSGRMAINVMDYRKGTSTGARLLANRFL